MEPQPAGGISASGRRTAEAIAVKKDEPKIRDLAETLVRAERQNDVVAAKELLAEDVIINTPQQETRGKDAAAMRLQEVICMAPAIPANDGPLQFEELEAIGDWAYFRLRFSGGSRPGHIYLRSIARWRREGCRRCFRASRPVAAEPRGCSDRSRARVP